MLFFTVYVLQRYFVRRSPQFLFWGIGLAMFTAGSFAEAYLALAWNRWAFFVWYLFGAALNAAWIGHGTLCLLARKKWVNAVTGVLIAASLFASYVMLEAMPTLDEGVFSTAKPVSEQYGSSILKAGLAVPDGAQTKTETVQGNSVTVVRGLLPVGAPVRMTTPFFNIYGLLTLVGGAIYSAFLFWRKRVLPNRVIGNVLIAAGALSIGFASVLTRLGNGRFLYLGELLAAVLMFAGFLTAGQPQTQERRSPARSAETVN
ncbi:MAG: hypothetical protein P4L50_23950 [Anaerolineaceae bacterium]|nr:hypothetical protein [Anaerolineaceae bacterium]